MSKDTLPPPKNPQLSRVLAEVKGSDLRYFCDRIAALKVHAVVHAGEPCERSCRARLGGMVEILNRIGLEVDTDWESFLPDVAIYPRTDYFDKQFKHKLIGGPL
jgi:hypothetical protein